MGKGRPRIWSTLGLNPPIRGRGGQFRNRRSMDVLEANGTFKNSDFGSYDCVSASTYDARASKNGNFPGAPPN